MPKMQVALLEQATKTRTANQAAKEVESWENSAFPLDGRMGRPETTYSPAQRMSIKWHVDRLRRFRDLCLEGTPNEATTMSEEKKKQETTIITGPACISPGIQVKATLCCEQQQKLVAHNPSADGSPASVPSGPYATVRLKR